jgi:tRNA-specific 2-thiouridylase
MGAPDDDLPLTAKVRSLARPVEVTLEDDALIFAKAEYGVAPGQAAVLYRGDRVMGGGWIQQSIAWDAALLDNVA